MLRSARLALFGLVLAAGCGGNSSPFMEGEAGEASGAESSGGTGGTDTNGGASGAAGSSSGGVAGTSGTSGDGGTATGGVSTGGTDTGGTDTGGTDTGGTDTGGTDTGGTGGAQGGDAGLGGIGARAGASGSTSTGGTAGATTSDPKCPLHKPDAEASCTNPGLRCPYDPTGCRCLQLISDRCYAVDSCLGVSGGAGGASSGARIAPPPAQYCVCVPTMGNSYVWNCDATTL
jgi:hypothetical protein